MIITHKHDDFYETVKDKEECAICGRRLHYPFLEWRGEQTFHICERCCSNNKQGLMADLIYITAITDLHEIGYGSQTLTRERHECVVRRKQEEERTAHEEILRQVDAELQSSEKIVVKFTGPTDAA